MAEACCSHNSGHPHVPGAGACRTRVEELSVELGGHRVIDRVSLEIRCGELLAVIGPNGAGKTTLLRTLLGELAHTGRVVFSSGHKGSGHRLRVGYVPQRLAFDPGTPLSVLDLFDAAEHCRPVFLGRSRARRQSILQALTATEAEHLADRTLGQLSGGELQRVLVALSLEPLPDLLLLDEPAAGLDPIGMERFYQVVSRLREKLDLAILLVSHDLAAVARVADRMIHLNKTILAVGTPASVLSRPEVRRAFGLDLVVPDARPEGAQP